MESWDRLGINRDGNDADLTDCSLFDQEPAKYERLSSITLHPAPGEEFELKVDMADEFLSLAEDSLLVSVSYLS